MGTVLAGGTVVTAVDCYPADVRMAGEQIAAVGQNIRQAGDRVVDVGGCLLFPGGIDPHTHFELEAGGITTADDFASGTQAAAVGGTTTIIDVATQDKGQSLAQALAVWHTKAGGRSYVDYGFHMAITDWAADTPREMGLMVREAGVSSFKLYMAYKHRLQVDDGVLLQALRTGGNNGALVAVHCENGDIIDTLVAEARTCGYTAPKYHALTRPAAAEQEAVERAILIAGMANAPLYIVHLSSRAALRAVQEAQSRGQPVFAETCPQYLLLDESRYESPGFEGAKYVMSPPLRPRENQQALWDGLKYGSIATVASDHCAFNFKGQKELGSDDFTHIPNGAPGVETRFGLLYTYGVAGGKISLNRFVALTSTNAAKLFGLFPEKGTIAPGSDADIVVWDPSVTAMVSAATHTQQVDYNPYEGFSQVGRAVHVFLRGRQIVEDGKLRDEAPAGRYLFRKPFARGGVACV